MAHARVAEHAQAPDEVTVGIEIDRGLLVDSLVGAGQRVDGLNPLSVSRYREEIAWPELLRPAA